MLFALLQSCELQVKIVQIEKLHIRKPTPEEIENAALFLRLGLPSTLIRHENEAFRKRSLCRRILHFWVDRKYFENEALRKR